MGPSPRTNKFNHFLLTHRSLGALTGGGLFPERCRGEHFKRQLLCAFTLSAAAPSPAEPLLERGEALGQEELAKRWRDPETSSLGALLLLISPLRDMDKAQRRGPALHRAEVRFHALES